jgi:uncharacterized protein (DUF488 family)
MSARLLTVGHGTATADELVALLGRAGVERLVDVRIHPGSRRHPQFGREAMTGWLAGAGVAYRWEPGLGGRRRPVPGSVNHALRNDAFRGYADYMRTPEFWSALDGLLARGAEVLHLDHRGRLEPHRPTDGVRRDGDLLAYDLGSTPPLPGS